MKLIPKNWAEFQHYRDRLPPWIKLHKGLLDDRQYQRLPLASRALAPMLWLLASESKEGAFDGSTEELVFRLRADEGEIEAGIAPLIAAGFFIRVGQVASAVPAPRERAAAKAQAARERVATDVLAGCEHVAVPETETETETKTDGENPAVAEPPAAADSCPHQQIIDLYHEVLPAARRVREWTPARQQALRTRWREKADRQNLDWWRRYFEYVAASDFLCGRTTPSNGRKVFEVSLDWLCKSENLVKVVEGAYEN